MTGNETSLVVGGLRHLMCSAIDIEVAKIEWKFLIAGFAPTLLSANNVYELSIQPRPQQPGIQIYRCVVISVTGVQYIKDVQVTVEGMYIRLCTMYHVDFVLCIF